jgi:hypothetical protein
MESKIDREALAEFVSRQVELVESAPIPKLLSEVAEVRLRREIASHEEARALWLGAGLATHVGLAILEEPERFVIAVPSPVYPRRGARRLTDKESPCRQSTSPQPTESRRPSGRCGSARRPPVGETRFALSTRASRTTLPR